MSPMAYPRDARADTQRGRSAGRVRGGALVQREHEGGEGEPPRDGAQGQEVQRRRMRSYAATARPSTGNLHQPVKEGLREAGERRWGPSAAKAIGGTRRTASMADAMARAEEAISATSHLALKRSTRITANTKKKKKKKQRACTTELFACSSVDAKSTDHSRSHEPPEGASPQKELVRCCV